MNEFISYGRFQCTELAPHKNRGMEITYIEKGMLEWMVEGVPEKVEAGMVFFTLPWQVHGSIHPREPENILWHVLFHLEEDYPEPRDAFRFPKSLGFSPREAKLLSTTLAGSARHGFRASPGLRRLVPELVTELQSTHELREAHARTLLRAVLVELKRVARGEVSAHERYTRSERRTQAFITELPSMCDRHWTLAAMARHCGIQRTQLNKIFQRLTGSSPMEYLFRLRMERAKTLLRESGVRITDIAFECGYGSSQYFANTFRKATGMSPSEYRNHSKRITSADLERWAAIGFRSEQEEQRRIRDFSRGK